jgi:hypothetical protein
MRLLERRVRNDDGPATPPAASGGPASGDGASAVRASKQVSARSAAVSARLDELRTQARFARQRYELYRAKSYGPRLTSPARLRELERESQRAEAALQFAKEEGSQADDVPTSPHDAPTQGQDVLSSPKRPQPR